MSVEDQSNYSGRDINDIDSVDEQPYPSLNFMYQTRDAEIMSNMYGDQYNIVQEQIKKVLQNVNNEIVDIEMNKKIPNTATLFSLAMCERVILPEAGVFDDSQNDYVTNGLIEDQEPIVPNKDAWIRSRIQVDMKNVELYDAIGKLPGGSFRKKTPDQRSVVSTKSKASSKQKRQKEEPKYNPMPIDLTEPLFITEEEAKLRKQKEEELIKKQLMFSDSLKKKQQEISEEQMKLQKFQKEKNVVGTTYDYNGEIMPVNRMKINRLPPSTHYIHPEFKDLQKEEEQKKKKIKNKMGLPRIKKKAEAPLPPIKSGIEQQPPILDNIPLSAGVTLIFDGRRRQGQRPQTFDSQTMSLTNLSTKDGKKVRLRRSEYDEIVNNQDKLGSHKFKEEGQTQIKMSRTAEQHKETLSQFGKTMDSMYFAGKLKNQAMRSLGSNRKDGGIKIEDFNKYETYNNQINEEDELLLGMLQKKEQEEKQKQLEKKLERLQAKTPVDEFNQTLAYNKEWGKQHYDSGPTLMNYPFGSNKPQDKDYMYSLGRTQKPRSRMDPKTPETFDVRVSTAEGLFARPGTQGDMIGDLRNFSSQGIRIKVTRNNQEQ